MLITSQSSAMNRRHPVRCCHRATVPFNAPKRCRAGIHRIRSDRWISCRFLQMTKTKFAEAVQIFPASASRELAYELSRISAFCSGRQARIPFHDSKFTAKYPAPGNFGVETGPLQTASRTTFCQARPAFGESAPCVVTSVPGSDTSGTVGNISFTDNMTPSPLPDIPYHDFRRGLHRRLIRKRVGALPSFLRHDDDARTLAICPAPRAPRRSRGRKGVIGRGSAETAERLSKPSTGMPRTPATPS